MRNRSHPRMAVALCLAALLAAQEAESAERQPDADPNWIEMEPARAAQRALAPIIEGAPRAVEIAIDSPVEGTIFSEAPIAHLYGSLEALGKTGTVDAVVVIDTSASTTRRAVRPNRVRQRHRSPKDPWRTEPASILKQEIRSAEVLLEDLDPVSTRLGIVTFAGAEDPALHEPLAAAQTEVPLTGGLEALDAGLQRILTRGAAGRTDMAAGLDRAVAELSGRGASRPDPAATQVIVFFTDGTPTLPHRHPDENERAVFEAADRAAAAGIQVFSFAIGPEALGRPTAAVEMARRTEGVFTPVRKPEQLAEAVRSTVEFTTVGGELEVRNTTLRVNARDLHVGDGGVFGGLVPLKLGMNRIFVRAVAGDLEIEAVRSVHYAPGSVQVYRPPPPRVLPVPTQTTRREMDIGAGARRTLELTLGDSQRKEIEFGLGPQGPPMP